MTAVGIPQPGQVVLLDGRAGRRFAARSVRLRLTRPIEAYPPGPGASVDSPHSAQWWLLTGTRLGPDEEPLGLCAITIPAGAVSAEPRPPAVSAGP